MQKLLIVLGISLFISSCATSYYQLHKVKPVFKSASEDGSIMYEDENCQVSYNLWAEGGNIGFDFYNKSSENIEINLKKSFFILNGYANDYYKNRVYTSARSNGVVTSNKAVGVSSLNASNSISMAEDSVIIIPTGTKKQVSEYAISSKVYRSCDLLRFPMGKDKQSLTFDSENSPLKFSNRIYYSKNGVGKEIRNEFFVSEITNYPSTQFYEYRSNETCKGNLASKTKQFKYINENSFYIKYTKTGETDRY